MPGEIGIVFERRTSLPDDKAFGVWVVLDRYHPDEDGPTYYSHPAAVELVGGLDRTAAKELARQLAALFRRLGAEVIESDAYDQ